MKYIDADILRKEIERHLERATAEQEKFPDMPKYRWYLREGKKELCNDLLDYMYDTLGVEEPITDSLQQEQPEVFDTVAFQKGVQEGRRLEREDVKSTIQSRIDEILGDAQPNPILRMELNELIKKIEE